MTIWEMGWGEVKYQLRIMGGVCLFRYLELRGIGVVVKEKKSSALRIEDVGLRPNTMAQWQDCRSGRWEAWGPEFNPRPGRVGV